jgi:hypothetical protein
MLISDGTMIFNNYQGATPHLIISDINSWDAGVWYHVVGVIHPTEGMKLYINGVLQSDTDSYSNPSDTTDFHFVMGRNGEWDIRYFKGAIDEVATFSSALSFSEIQAIYNAGSDGMCKPDDVLENYPTLFNGRTVIPSVGSHVPHGPFNNGAKTGDALGIVDVTLGLTMGSTATVESGRLDTELLTWPGLTWQPGYMTQDVVSVGGPVVSLVHHKNNDPLLAEAWWDYNSWEIVTTTGGRYSDPGGRHSYITLIDDGGRYIMLGSGYTAAATRDVCKIIRNYNDYPTLLQGRACVFIPNDLNSDGDCLDPDELEILEIIW